MDFGFGIYLEFRVLSLEFEKYLGFNCHFTLPFSYLNLGIMLDKKNIPRHIAFIMDGNGRWAKERGLSRSEGHRAGVSRIKEIVEQSQQLGIGVVSFFAFSSENWQRPKKEINVLMNLLDRFLNRQIKKLNEKNIRFVAIGRDDPVPSYLQAKIKEAEEKTKNNTAMTFVLAINYGSRQEIVDAVKDFTVSVIKGRVKLEDLDENSFSRYLYTKGLPEPDLLIRTSGEMRISNFLLWQLSYAELYFAKEYWPDFGRESLQRAIEVYQGRERRFGRVGC